MNPGLPRGANDVLAQRYGLSYGDICRLDPQVIGELARIAYRQQQIEERSLNQQ